jgi:hypothetical protein
MLTFTISEDSLTFIANGKPYSVSASHNNFEKIKQKLMNREHNVDVLVRLVNEEAYSTQTKLENENLSDKVYVKDGFVWYENQVIHNSLTERIIEMQRRNLNIEPMKRFLENLMENPSRESILELYGFLEKNTLPITPDGHFLAYKKVRSDFRDIYSGTKDNSPGSIVEMPREAVNPNRSETCSTGLHFASYDYMGEYGVGDGSVIVVVKINPRDVVSIPTDYNNAKGRCCRYEVIAALDQTQLLKDYVDDDRSYREDNSDDMYDPYEEWEEDFDEEDYVDPVGYGDEEKSEIVRNSSVWPDSEFITFTTAMGDTVTGYVTYEVPAYEYPRDILEDYLEFENIPDNAVHRKFFKNKPSSNLRHLVFVVLKNGIKYDPPQVVVYSDSTVYPK